MIGHLTVDGTRCEGTGFCVGIAPLLFDLDDNGIAHCIAQPEADSAELVREAIETCPTRAVRLRVDPVDIT